MAKRNDESINTLERGNIFFFYRPKVDEDHPDDASDVQRLYMVLNPSDTERYRLTVIGHKKLPDLSRAGRKRYWGFVDSVSHSPEKLLGALSEEEYETKTRGERRQPPARPVGEGVYRILRHGDHVHLVYALELPDQPGKPQRAFNIEDEASYIISIKNPEKKSPHFSGLSVKRKAELPKYLSEKFHDRQFIAPDPTKFLDHSGVEFILISASDDVEEDLGITLHPKAEDEHSAQVFKELHVDRSKFSVKPLLQGEWR